MLEKIKIMAIIREVDPEITIEVIKALAEEGLQSFEISLSDPELGIEAIRRSLEYFQGSDVRIGAGTVSTVKQVDRTGNPSRGLDADGCTDGFESWNYADEAIPGRCFRRRVYQGIERSLSADRVRGSRGRESGYGGVLSTKRLCRHRSWQ